MDGINDATFCTLLQLYYCMPVHRSPFSIEALTKLYFPSTVNIWLMFWHKKWGTVCGRMLNH
jgi:hypothetical protein